MTDYTPAQPHFDDERTLLSARPVVPLEKIHHRRNWLLGGAFVLAMMLGAGSALLAWYLKLRSVHESVPQVSQEEIAPAPLPVAESVPSVEEPSPAPVVIKKESTAKQHKATAKRASDVDLPRNEPQVSEQDDLQHIRDAVLYDQWQERRARRVRREQRRIDRYNHRDLSNLDEIFEGRKRP